VIFNLNIFFFAHYRSIMLCAWLYIYFIDLNLYNLIALLISFISYNIPCSYTSVKCWLLLNINYIIISAGKRDGCIYNEKVAGSAKRATVPPIRVWWHRGDGQVGLQRSNHFGFGDTHGDGQGYESFERVSSDVGGWSSRGRLRISVDGQGISVHTPN